MSATVCPVGMFLRRVTIQMAYPASTNGANHRRDIWDHIPVGMALPGPPGMKSSAFGPLPQVRNSIPFANVPLRRPRTLAMRLTALSTSLGTYVVAFCFRRKGPAPPRSRCAATCPTVLHPLLSPGSRHKSPARAGSASMIGSSRPTEELSRPPPRRTCREQDGWPDQDPDSSIRDGHALDRGTLAMERDLRRRILSSPRKRARLRPGSLR